MRRAFFWPRVSPDGDSSEVPPGERPSTPDRIGPGLALGLALFAWSGLARSPGALSPPWGALGLALVPRALTSFGLGLCLGAFWALFAWVSALPGLALVGVP